MTIHREEGQGNQKTKNAVPRKGEFLKKKKLKIDKLKGKAQKQREEKTSFSAKSGIMDLFPYISSDGFTN